MRPRSPQDDTQGLEGPLRTAMGALDASLPSLLDRAARCPVILTRGGSDAFVFLPLDTRGRPWPPTPRPPAFDAHCGPDG